MAGIALLNNESGDHQFGLGVEDNELSRAASYSPASLFFVGTAVCFRHRCQGTLCMVMRMIASCRPPAGRVLFAFLCLTVVLFGCSSDTPSSEGQGVDGGLSPGRTGGAGGVAAATGGDAAGGSGPRADAGVPAGGEGAGGEREPASEARESGTRGGTGDGGELGDSGTPGDDGSATTGDGGPAALDDAGAAAPGGDAGADGAVAGDDADTASPGVLLGVYCGNAPDDILQFESWLGRRVDGILGYTGHADWDDFDGSVGWAVGLWSGIDRRVFWSVPLIPTGATLDEAAAGTYDDHYRQAAETLAAYRPQDPELHVRTGWEFNGDWFPWTAQGKAQAFIGAFRQFVTVFRSVSNRFVFEWNVNVGDVGMNPEDAYPGDAYVDIIGMDFYWNTQWDPIDPSEAWSDVVSRTYGLQWHQDFAADHGKPTAYSEWGIMSNDGGPYIEQAKAWFESHDVVFHTYWNSNAAFTGKLSDGQYPNAGAAYREAFGVP